MEQPGDIPYLFTAEQLRWLLPSFERAEVERCMGLHHGWDTCWTRESGLLIFRARKRAEVLGGQYSPIAIGNEYIAMINYWAFRQRAVKFAPDVDLPMMGVPPKEPEAPDPASVTALAGALVGLYGQQDNCDLFFDRVDMEKIAGFTLTDQVLKDIQHHWMEQGVLEPQTIHYFRYYDTYGIRSIPQVQLELPSELESEEPCHQS